MGTDLRWARARAVAEGREGVFVAVVVPRCLSLSRDVILKSGSPFHQQQVIQSSGRMFHS